MSAEVPGPEGIPYGLAVRRRIEELGWAATPMGEISLRRRFDPQLQADLYEVRLGEEFLMSSAFTVAEEELARLGLADVGGEPLDVLVGGLGLGCTAAAALEDPRVRSLVVVEALAEVAAWHERGLLPLSERLTGDPRCAVAVGDFFALVQGGLDGVGPGRWHALLVDIDHSPRHVLHPSHAAFYTAAGLTRLAAHLHDGGVFALWSDDPPDQAFLALLGEVLDAPRAVVVPFANPVTGGESTNTVYLARRRPGS